MLVERLVLVWETLDEAGTSFVVLVDVDWACVVVVVDFLKDVKNQIVTNRNQH